MKVLHVIPSVSNVHGGPSHAIRMIERSLFAAGVAVTTLTTDDDGPGRRLVVTSQPRSIDGTTRHYARKWTEFYKFSPSLLGWLLHHARDFDVIHIHALFSFSSVAAALAAWVRGVPYILRPLGTLNAYGVKKRRPILKSASFSLIESRILSHAAAVHFTSQAEWDEAKALGVPLHGVIIPLGVEGPETVEKDRLSLKGSPQPKVVIFLSRLDPKKNVEGLLKAFALIRKRHLHTSLVIAGDGPAEYVRSLKALAEVEGIAEATSWTGHLQGKQKWKALEAADIFVLPSFSENFGIAAVEALVAGRPCVIGAGVAIAETIAGAGAGLVTNPDPASIARALDLLLGDERLCRKMGACGRDLADREYTSRLMGQRLLELYSDIAFSAGPSPHTRSPDDAIELGQSGRSKEA